MQKTDNGATLSNKFQSGRCPTHPRLGAGNLNSTSRDIPARAVEFPKVSHPDIASSDVVSVQPYTDVVAVAHIFSSPSDAALGISDEGSDDSTQVYIRDCAYEHLLGFYQENSKEVVIHLGTGES